MASMVTGEFLAEETLVSIVPKFRHDRLQFVTGFYGPFVPQRPVEVPLWLACRLWRSDQCRLVVPEWLEAGNLEACRDDETKSAESFSMRVPKNYQELCATIFEEDDASGTAPTVADVATIRGAKIRSGVFHLAKAAANDETTHSVKMNSVGTAEVADVRAQLLLSLKRFFDLRKHSLPLKRDLPRRGGTTTTAASSSEAHAAPRRQLRRFR